VDPKDGVPHKDLHIALNIACEYVSKIWPFRQQAAKGVPGFITRHANLEAQFELMFGSLAIIVT
jgi:hypothetical protein